MRKGLIYERFRFKKNHVLKPVELDYVWMLDEGEDLEHILQLVGLARVKDSEYIKQTTS